MNPHPTKEPAFDPHHVQEVSAAPHPLRYAINGVEDKLPALREFIAAQDIDPDLKTYIGTELDEITTNAAVIDLHNVDFPGGGFDLHLSIRARQHGGHSKSITRGTDLSIRPPVSPPPPAGPAGLTLPPP